MTNGEKIKEIFPNIIKYGNILIDDTGALQKNILFDDTWWNAEYIEPTTKNDLPHCQCTDAEIAKSFLEDVETVKDQLPCGEQMDFPSTFDEFAKDYGFKDKDEVYTNGSELIPVFRVKQWLEHINATTAMIDKSNFSQEQYKADLQSAYDCGYGQAKNDLGVDCISRTSALDSINWAYNLSDAYQKINDLPSVTPQEPRWISVSERLPEKNMACLVAVGRFNITQIAVYSDLMGIIDHRIFYQGDVGHDNFKDITQYVKAWMPLPKPYREVKE